MYKITHFTYQNAIRTRISTKTNRYIVFFPTRSNTFTWYRHASRAILETKALDNSFKWGAWGTEREDRVLISDINPYFPKRKVGLPLNAVKKIRCTETGTEGCNKYNNHIAGLRTVAQAMAGRGLLRGYGHGVPCRKVVSSWFRMEFFFKLQ